MTRDQVCAFRLSGHHLDRRMQPGQFLEAVAACGIQDSPPGSAVLALSARVEDLNPAGVTAALEVGKTIVLIRSLRGAPHLVPVRDAAVFTAGLLPANEDELRFFIRGASPVLDAVGMTAVELVDLVAPALLDALQSGPLAFRALSADLTGRVARQLPAGRSAAWWSPGPFAEGQSLGEALVHFALYPLALQGLYCYAPRQDGEAAFVRVDRWLGGALPPLDPAHAQAGLVRRYLRCFGPSTARHFGEWAGVAPSCAERAWALVEPDLVEVGLDGRRAWLHAHDLTLLEHPPEPGGVRLLPPHDPYLALRDRATLLPDARLHRDVWKTAGGPGAVLAGGRPVGLWRPQKKGSSLHVTVDAFAPLTEAVRAEIVAEAGRMAAVRGVTAGEVIFMASRA